MTLALVIGHLRTSPYVTAREVAARAGCSLKTAQSDLARFTHAGLTAKVGTVPSANGTPAFRWALTDLGRSPDAVFPSRTKPKGIRPRRDTSNPEPTPCPVRIVRSAIRRQSLLSTVWNPAWDCTREAA
jgi:hypothetical protein